MKKVVVIFCVVILAMSIVTAREFEASANVGVSGLGFGDTWGLCPVLGLSVSTPVMEKITGEAEIFYYLNPAKSLPLEGSEISSYAINLNISGLYHFTLKKTKLKPYAVIGIGLFGFHSEFNWAGFEDTVSNKWFNAAFGGGAQWPLDKKAGLRFDIRYIFIPGAQGDFLRITIGYSRKI